MRLSPVPQKSISYENHAIRLARKIQDQVDGDGHRISSNDNLSFRVQLSMIIDNGSLVDDSWERSFLELEDACAAVGRHHR
jgi:hypothetical protein